VLVENNAPGTLEALGLDYETLRGINPKLVMVAITPFGQKGPYKDYKAYNIKLLRHGRHVHRVGDPKREPLTMPFSQGGYQAGVTAASAIMAALLSRRKTGSGQYIDIFRDRGLGYNPYRAECLNQGFKGASGLRRGIHGGKVYPCEILPCKDGYVSLIAPQIEQWEKVGRRAGHPRMDQRNPGTGTAKAIAEQIPG